jgi:hypothetical protein
MSLRLVSHVYAGKHPQYAKLLQYQLSSLILYHPHIATHISICYTPVDTLTADVLRWFAGYADCDVLRLTALAFEPGDLFRRAIGRNRASLGCDDDVVWFTDVDHFFGLGCIDSAVEQFRAARTADDAVMIYPRHVWVSRNGDVGDAAIERAQGICDIDPHDFVKRRYRRAIGGVQIVDGAFAGAHGYLANTKWQRPAEQPFRDFRDDVAFRSYCGRHGQIVPVVIPNLFRIRHSMRCH